MSFIVNVIKAPSGLSNVIWGSKKGFVECESCSIRWWNKNKTEIAVEINDIK